LEHLQSRNALSVKNLKSLKSQKNLPSQRINSTKSTILKNLAIVILLLLAAKVARAPHKWLMENESSANGLLPLQLSDTAVKNKGF
jgi:hypothetical protein